MRIEKHVARGKAGWLILLPLLFFLVPTSWLEAHPPVCLSRLIFKRRCPGCGMTRAISCAAHGQFRKAWHYNKLVVIVLPLLTHSWLREVLRQSFHWPYL